MSKNQAKPLVLFQSRSRVKCVSGRPAWSGSDIVLELSFPTVGFRGCVEMSENPRYAVKMTLRGLRGSSLQDSYLMLGEVGRR